jgi:hypothetical protein
VKRLVPRRPTAPAARPPPLRPPGEGNEAHRNLESVEEILQRHEWFVRQQRRLSADDQRDLRQEMAMGAVKGLARLDGTHAAAGPSDRAPTGAKRLTIMGGIGSGAATGRKNAWIVPNSQPMFSKPAWPGTRLPIRAWTLSAANFKPGYAKLSLTFARTNSDS